MIEKNKLKRMVINTGSKKRVLYTYSSDSSEIKKLHEAYASFLSVHFMPSIFSHAYTKNRSIYTNARVHLLNDVFIKVDVKNYFPSINHRYLADAIYFELNKSKKSSDIISLRESHSLIGKSSIHSTGLPLGLIPSPMLSNIYMKKFDGLLYGKLKELNLQDIRYTRYADDIFVSFKREPNDTASQTPTCEKMVDICREELRRCHLNINDRKTRFIDLAISNHVKLAGINLVKMEDGKQRLTVSRETVKDLYFEALSLHDSIKSIDTDPDTSGELNAEINSAKGMQSFILSVEKTGYSHILSEKMREGIRSRGYDTMEDLVANLKSPNTK